MPPSAEYVNLPFDEAIAFFRQKVNIPTKRWNDLWQGMHARGFMVAGAMKDDLLCDLRGAVDKGIAEGTTLETFRKDFDGIIDKHGWKYRGNREWRTAVIFNTNLSTAYAAGQHKQMTSPAVLKARPFWRYVPSSSASPRAEHAGWYNIILPADHPWWNTHRPPNGWGCKCGLVNHSAREVERLKKEEVDGEYPVKTKAPKQEYWEWEDKATGKKHKIPEGIDPGWDYNVGEAAWGRNQALREMEDQGPWKDINPWGPDKYDRPAKISTIDTALAQIGKPVKKDDVEALRDSLRKALGGDQAYFTDPVGGIIAVNQAIVDHIMESPEKRWDGREAFFPLIREIITDPFEIWISFARSEQSGRIGIRRKYVKAVRLGGKKTRGMYAETMNGFWQSGDFFRGKLTEAGRIRKGRLIYGRE